MMVAETAPVLLLVFNRPTETRQVFEAVRRASPRRLYIAADGPRPDRPGEAERVAETRAICTAVDWDCEVRTLFRDANLGCRRAVSSAIDWFFQEEPEGIILEDDCLPSPDFFGFCSAVLHRYRNEPAVGHISGSNFFPRPDHPSSYYFTRQMPIWGWATWRRAWARYDRDMIFWQSCDRDALLKRMLLRPESARYLRPVFDRVAAGEIDTWDYQWGMTCWANGFLAVMPRANLIRNVGFSAGATHTVQPPAWYQKLQQAPLGWPLAHPGRIEVNEAADLDFERIFVDAQRQTRLANRIVAGLRRRLRC